MTFFAEVLKAGPLTTIQDLGRPAYVSLGVPVGGAMDPLALRLANLSLGNPPEAAALEVTLQRLELRILARATLSVGGFPQILLNDRELKPHSPFAVKSGDELKLLPRSGARAYVACAGGIAAKPVLGSASTYVPAAFGGFEGRALRSGDRLAAGRARVRRKIRPVKFPSRENRLVLRFVAADSRAEEYLAGGWRVDPRSDRMGVRLWRKYSFWNTSASLPSRGAFPGLIQIPPDGSPILLGADAQTIGGYAIAGTVALADLWKIGQLLPGETLSLESISRARAVALWRAQQKVLG